MTAGRSRPPTQRRHTPERAVGPVRPSSTALIVSVVTAFLATIGHRVRPRPGDGDWVCRRAPHTSGLGMALRHRSHSGSGVARSSSRGRPRGTRSGPGATVPTAHASQCGCEGLNFCFPSPCASSAASSAAPTSRADGCDDHVPGFQPAAALDRWCSSHPRARSSGRGAGAIGHLADGILIARGAVLELDAESVI